MDFGLVFLVVVALALILLETAGAVAKQLLKCAARAVLIIFALIIRLQKRLLLWAADCDPGVLAFLIFGFAFYFFLLSPAAATCHGDSESLVCGAGGLCDMAPNPGMKFLALNTDLNPPGVPTVNYYFPNLQVSSTTL